MMTKLRYPSARGALVLILACSCSSSPAPQNEPPITVRKELALERFYAARVPDGSPDRMLGKSIVGAFDGAAQKGEVLVIRDASGKELARGTVDDQGRFKIGIDAEPGTVLEVSRLQGDPQPIEMRVRDPEQARKDAIAGGIGPAGMFPNDLVFCGTKEHPRLVLVRSGDNAVNEFDLVKGLDGKPGIRLPDVGGKNADPYYVAALDSDCKRIAVTALLQRRVYVIDLDAGQITSTLIMSAQATIDPPLSLPRPVDVEGNGTMVSEVSHFTPTQPGPIAVLDGKIWVAFSGFISPRLGADKPPVYVPGVLASWRIDALDAGPELFVLPVMNPNEIRIQGDHQLLIVCTGVLDFVGTSFLSTTPGAALFFDVKTKQVTDRIDLGDFGPSTALVGSGALWVGSSLRAVLRRVDLADKTTTRDYILSNASFGSVFRLIELDGGLIAAPSFDEDRLYILDTRSGTLSPAPFFAPLQVGPGSMPQADGLQIVAKRPGRAGIDFTGPDLYALANIASKVVPIELRKLLGP